MIDGYGRTIEYMRISITDRCNLRCRYCMPDGVELVSMSDLLSFEEIEEKDFNLLISSYVVAEDKKKDVDIEKINTRVAELTKKVNMLRLEVDDIVAEIRRAQDE